MARQGYIVEITYHNGGHSWYGPFRTRRSAESLARHYRRRGVFPGIASARSVALSRIPHSRRQEILAARRLNYRFAHPRQG